MGQPAPYAWFLTRRGEAGEYPESLPLFVVKHYLRFFGSRALVRTRVAKCDSRLLMSACSHPMLFTAW